MRLSGSPRSTKGRTGRWWYAFARRRRRDRQAGRRAVTTVRVAGVGLHPFGRFDGVSVTDMGVVAAAPR